MHKYDLFVVNPVREPFPRDDQDHALLEICSKRGWVSLDKGLSEVRRLLQKIRQYHGNAYAVNKNYRAPRVTLEEASSIAGKVYEEMLKTGARLDVLSEGFDDALWWTFRAEDINAVEKGLIPGTITISVDKLDGHLRTREEYSEWLKLSTFD